MTKKEVQKALRCQHSTVDKLEKAGILVDRKTRVEGRKKHYGNYSKSMVDRVARVYRQRMSVGELKSLLSASLGKPKVQVQPEVQQEENIRDSFMDRLKKIEEMLNLLVRRWS